MISRIEVVTLGKQRLTMTTLNHNATHSKNDRAFRLLGGLIDGNIDGLMSSSYTAHPGLITARKSNIEPSCGSRI